MALSVRGVAGLLAAGLLAAPAAAAAEKPPIGPYLQECKNPRIGPRQLLIADCPGGPKTAMQWKRCPSIVWNPTTGMLDCGAPMESAPPSTR